MADPDENVVEPEDEEYKTRYLRALADYQNLERRMQDDRSQIKKMSIARVVSEFLPVLDVINQAEIFIKDAGLKMVKDQFEKTLKELGVKEVEVLHKEFDPNVAEAVDVVAGEKDNEVVEVLRKGYRYDGMVIRVAQVRVSKKSDA